MSISSSIITQLRAPGFLDRLNDVAGQRADIGAPVATDFRFVVHAAQADPHEWSPHRARNGLTQRSLADAGRTDEAENRRLALRRQLPDRQIFDDPALDLLQTVVILIEDSPCLGNVDRLLLRQAPGQFDQPVEIASDHACLGGRLRHALIAANFLSRLAFRLGRHPGLGDGLVQLRDLLRLAVALPKLALNGRHLLAKDRFPLTLVEGRLCLLSDLMAEPKHFDALGQMARNLVHAEREIDRLEDFLLLLRLDIHVGRREVGQVRGRGGALQYGDQFLRSLWKQFCSLNGLPLQVEEAGLDFRRRRCRFRYVKNARRQKRSARKIVEHPHALHSLTDEVMTVIGPGDVAHDIGDSADAV